MRVDAVLLAFLTTFSAASASWFSSSQSSLDEETYPVPGDNPLLYCDEPKDYLLDIDHVDLDPNPPKAGKSLEIKANGTLSKDIEKGAKVHLQVKYGLIRILNTEVDLCDYAEEVDLKCPLKKGDLELKKSVDLPSEIPKGSYTVLADVFTEDKEKITCLNAKVTFGFGSDSNEVDLDL